MITDARTLAPGSTIGTEILVIGAGPAGITLALSLMAAGRQVVVLESSATDDPAAMALNQGTVSGHHIVDGIGNEHSLDTTRRRALGGATRDNGGNLGLPRWAGYNGQPGFDWDGLTPATLAAHYARAHDLIGLGPVNYDPAYWAGVTGVALPPPVLEAWKLNQINGRDFNDHVPGLEANPNVTLLVNGNAVQLNTNSAGDTVTSVTVRTLTGVELSITAQVVVLSAGSLESTRLLLCSNDVVPAGLGNQYDQVGRCFGDDLGLSWGLGLMEVPANPWLDGISVNTTTPSGDPASVYLTLSSTLSQATMQQLGLPGCVLGGIFQPSSWDPATPGSDPLVDAGGSVIATSRAMNYSRGVSEQSKWIFRLLMDAPDMVPSSRVMLNWSSLDTLGMPRLDLDWQLSLSNSTYFATFWRRAQKVAESIGSLIASFGVFNPFAGGGMPALPDVPALNWQTQFHHNYMLRMGLDPASSVVDLNLRVHTTANLFAVCSGVFQSPIKAAPTSTVVALANRLGSHLNQEVLL